MSRVAKKPITLPKDVSVEIKGQALAFKGTKGKAEYTLHPDVEAHLEAKTLTMKPRVAHAMPITGTMRAIVNNFVIGVSSGFTRKLELKGVGYRAQVKGKILNLALGFSHPVDYPIPDGITIETPTQTEVLIHGIDKAQVGQVAAEVRAFRPPEPYKGKGVRYANEVIELKETKKKK